MPDLVFYLLVFLAIGVFFLFIHLMLGKLFRPNRPDAEKMTIYECGEPTVGSAWVQFDLRYYVVALLFVVFDVEVAFFFPWAVVFGKANELARLEGSNEQYTTVLERLVTVDAELIDPKTAEAEKAKLSAEKERLLAERDRIKTALNDNAPKRKALTQELAPADLNLVYLEMPRKIPVPKNPNAAGGGQGAAQADGKGAKGGPDAKVDLAKLPPLGFPGPPGAAKGPAAPVGSTQKSAKPADVRPIDPETAKAWAWIALFDLLVFFGVLMVGFAYLWRRGDIDWVRSTAAETGP
jgi:NADH:ubiquinone oxidoreductase subunit 3 (subunit A)